MTRFQRFFTISSKLSSRASASPTFFGFLKDNAGILTMCGGGLATAVLGLNYVVGLQIKPLEIKLEESTQKLEMKMEIKLDSLEKDLENKLKGINEIKMLLTPLAPKVAVADSQIEALKDGQKTLKADFQREIDNVKSDASSTLKN